MSSDRRDDNNKKPMDLFDEGYLDWEPRSGNPQRMRLLDRKVLNVVRQTNKGEVVEVKVPEDLLPRGRIAPVMHLLQSDADVKFVAMGEMQFYMHGSNKAVKEIVFKAGSDGGDNWNRPVTVLLGAKLAVF